MEITPRSLCLLLALFVFVVAAFWTPPPTGGRPVSLVALGLALLTLSFLLP